MEKVVTLQDWGSIGEIVGSMAVVATLIYLSIQTRQNTRTVRASTISRTAQTLAETLRSTSQSSELASILSRAYNASGYRDETLTTDEWNRFAWHHAGLAYQLEDYFWQFRDGALDAEIWNTYSLFWRNNIEMPSLRGWWAAETAAGSLTPTFVSAINSIRPTGGGELRRQGAGSTESSTSTTRTLSGSE